MLLFLQIAAFCQLFFLPGLLILYALRLRTAPVMTLLLAVPLSGLFNYLLVLLLDPPGLFTREAVSAVFLLEAGLAVLHRVRSRRAGRTRTDRPAGQMPIAVSLPAFATLLIQLGLAIRGFGTIFLSWDSVLSWNRWAAAWADGTFTGQQTFGYPQLIPCNWAVAYQLIGEPLNFVPKGIALLCPALISLLLIELARQRRQYALLLAVPLTAWFFRNTDPLAGGGEADFMIAFYCFASIGFLIYNLREHSRKLTLCAGLTAVCAACAKQSGIVFLLLIPILAYAWNILRGKEFRNALGIYAALAVLFVAPYYLYFANRVGQGAERSTFQTVTCDIYGNKTRGEIAVSALKVFLCRLEAGVPTDSVRRAGIDFSGGVLRGIGRFCADRWLVLALTSILSVLVLIYAAHIPVWSRLFYGFAIPYTLVWMLFYSYDLRNLMPVQPLLACGFAFAAVRMWSSATGRGTRRGRREFAGCGLLRTAGARIAAHKRLGLLLSGILLLGILPAASRIDFRRIQNEQKRRIGSPGLNRELKQAEALKPFATDYQFLEFIPGFGSGSFVFVEYSLAHQLTRHREAAENPQVKSFLVPDYAAKEFQEDLARRLKNGKIQLIFHKYGYRLYEKTTP